MTDPTDARDRSDPGDHVIRKFRYQHAYGVVLSIRLLNSTDDYIAIWCEQHEDLLAETNDGFFDAYQVKTRKSELGEWQLNDPQLVKSIRRFVDLDGKFPGRIRSFWFVSNTNYSNSNDARRKHLSPVKLLRAVDAASDWQKLVDDPLKGFNKLKVATESDPSALFKVLKKTEVVLGPTERAFEDELCQRHISRIPGCDAASATALAKVRESLLALVAYAASLSTDDPSRDYVGLTKENSKDPYLYAKRLSANDIYLAVRDAYLSHVQFDGDLATLDLGRAAEKKDVLRKKMTRGGLGARFEAMRRKSITAERMLLDWSTRPGSGKAICSQIENIVLGECDEANLRAASQPDPYGNIMLIDVQDRLKSISLTDGKKVHDAPYEVLVGVAGLLSSECKVWWSEEFDLGEAE